MTEQTNLLLKLLEEGKTCNEMCNILHLSNKQLYNNLTNLKKKGILFSKKYFETGDIAYKTIYNKEDLSSSNTVKIITNTDSKNIKVLVISDLHFGNSKERIDLINKAYDYCINNNINLIFCCGDLIDGTFSSSEQKISNAYNQIDYFIKNYPFDKNILTFGVGGDHDLSCVKHYGQDLIESLNNYRHDIIIPDYNNVFIELNNLKILLHHHIKGDTIIDNRSINFFGHSHKYTISTSKSGQINVRVPSLSDINVQTYNTLPTLLEVTFTFSNNNLDLVHFTQLYFKDLVYILNEISIEVFNKKRCLEDGKIEEFASLDYEDVKIKKLDQVEKFNLRYKKNNP